VSYARLARKESDAPASRSTAAPSYVSAGLRISEPGDAYEREAESVASEVMTRGVRHHWSLPTLVGGTSLQRACACGGSGECQQCAQDKESPTLQRKAAGAADSGIAPPIVDEALKSPSRPLDEQTRAYFEPRLGYDLSAVRVHADARAAESARALHALAYTFNNDIVFGQSQYAPSTLSGRKLLAHELTHTIQQSSRPGLSLQRQADEVETNDQDQGGQDDEAHDGDTPVITAPPQQTGQEQDEVASAADPGVLLADNSPEEMKGGGKKPAPPPPPKITSIDVDLASQQITLHFNDGSTESRAISSGKGQAGTDGDPCKTQTEKNCTPEGDFKIVSKGNEDTKNSHGDAMAWYVELGGDKVIDGRGIGIHDSQPVGGGPRSHGCVRVGDSAADRAFAKKINKGADVGTPVHIKGKAPTKAWGSKPAPKSKPKEKKK
jgi:hypothetical protein